MANLFKSTEARLLNGLPRTRFPFEKRHTTSFDSGRLIPLLCVETLPGDTWKIDVASLIRMQTPIAPIMDDIYMDYYFFYVPNRIISNALSVNGKGNFDKVVSITSGFSGTIDSESVETLQSSGDINILTHSVGDYIGLPIGVYSNDMLNKITSHISNGYTMIYNYYFRDENYQTEFALTSDLAGVSTTLVEEPLATYNVLNRKPFVVNNLHNLFTSVLPSPQKGPSVLLPLGDRAPLKASDGSAYIPIDFQLTNALPGTQTPDVIFKPQRIGDGSVPSQNGSLSAGSDNVINASLLPVKAYVDLADSTAASINQLREAALMQQFLETAARSGTRYKEFIKGFFGVDIGDSTLQQPEFIAEFHMNINISEVIQTSGINSEDGTTLGTTGAVSRSAKASNNLLTYSSTEYGYLYCVACVRHKLSYSQGIEPMWTRLKGTDFYNPAWEGIGEVGIKTRQILAPVGYNSNIMKAEYSQAGSSVDWDEEIGFNEAFAEYKYFTNRTSGILNPVAKEGLDYWTLATAFTGSSVSAAAVRLAGKGEIDRALSITNQPQFIGDILFHGSVVRKMRKFSTPGIDRI